MSASPVNALSYNQYIQQLGVMAVASTVETSGVWGFADAPLQAIVPMILNYAELRIQRDMDFLSSQSSNTYTLTPGQAVFPVPFNDFFTIQTVEIVQPATGQVVNSQPLLPVSKEFIQNCYGGLSSVGTPQYFAMYGDNFGDNQDTVNNIVFGPVPGYPFTIRITGTAKSPSLYQYASAGIADTNYTYISNYLPDMLLMASMIYVSGFQRNWTANADDLPMGTNYEKQYQSLRLGAIAEENRRKFQGSGWSSYSTPTAATPTR